MGARRRKIILISSYRPRDCGIATFSNDLINNLELHSDITVEIIPINEPKQENRVYGDKVRTTISSPDKYSYIEAANYINNSDAVALSIQHEYGLYGGERGEYILDLINLVNKPIITTFHTVLSDPDPKRKEILEKIAAKSNTVIVMATTAVDILTSSYDIPKEKIIMIPHGVPEVAFDNQKKAKEALDLSDKIVISTFGLLGPVKGLEYVLRALPQIIIDYPNIKYSILGRTHPQVIEQTGETYRNKLVEEITTLGLSNHVKQENRFLSDEEINLNLLATDIYITPYLNPQQITSGTLARAVSIGRACISTPYIYAKELLADGRGILVPFADSDSIAKAIRTLLSDDKKRNEIEHKNYEFSRPMTWKTVANKYVDLLRKITS